VATKTAAPKTKQKTFEGVPPASVFGEGNWITYQAELTFLGKLYGGSPFDPKLVEGWLAKSLGISDEEQLKEWTLRHIEETQGLAPGAITDEAIEKAIAENAVEKKAQGFKRTPDGKPYIEGRHLKAMLKEATNIAFPQGENKWGQYRNTTGKTVGGKPPLSYVAERVSIPERPYVVADDSDDFEFAIGHIEDWKGRRSTIGYFEYCEKPVLALELQVLNDCLSHDQWAEIWRVAERNGLGARRSQGGGQFVVTHWKRI
jgi:hypothetical protein